MRFNAAVETKENGETLKDNTLFVHKSETYRDDYAKYLSARIV